MDEIGELLARHIRNSALVQSEDAQPRPAAQRAVGGIRMLEDELAVIASVRRDGGAADEAGRLLARVPGAHCYAAHVEDNRAERPTWRVRERRHGAGAESRCHGA